MAATSPLNDSFTQLSLASQNKQGNVPAYLVNAHGSTSTKGLVVLQEWWGINDQIKRRAVDIAKEGFRVVVPDLYRGKIAIDHEEAGHMLGDLDWPGAIQDVLAAAAYLKNQGCTRVGVVGYCMGGALSLASNVLITEIDAAVAYYGTPNAALADPVKTKKPVQCHFGNNDVMKGFADPVAATKLEDALKLSGAPFEFYRYDNAGHAFTNEDHPDTYNKAAHALSTERMIKFFNTHLSASHRGAGLRRVELDSAHPAGKLPAYHAGEEHKLGLVVLQEWWGVNDQIKNRAFDFAAQGFHAIIPDLYRGKVATDREQAGHLMHGLDWPGAVKDIIAAAEFLKKSGCVKVGCVGYCMGGALSLAGGILAEPIDAAVVYYGICDARLADPTKAKKPIQGHFGSKDTMAGFSDPAAATKLGESLKASGAPYEIHMYAAGHAFTNESRADAFHEPSYKLATERTLAFFRKHLA